MSAHDDLMSCRNYVLEALRREMKRRESQDDWVRRERLAVTHAANTWALAHGCTSRWTTVDDVERIESAAIGHVDYASKLALYIAESVVAAAAAVTEETP